MSVGHYENFPVASVLLPRRLRPAVAAIYWFARSADDFADEGDLAPAERLARLDCYREALRGIASGRPAADPRFERLAGAIRAHGLPLQAFHDLLDAFSQDVVKRRYANFDEVLDYCRRSANPVGLLMLHLFRAATAQNIRWSDAICTALQLINFWQDVAIDLRKDRIYFPRDEMARHGVSEADLFAARAEAPFRELMAFQVSRARALLESGAPLARAVGGRSGFELRMVVQGGLRILEKIDRVRGDVFRHRPALRGSDWLLMLWRAAARYPR
ncbi:MAG TPA: squalene synthase HpnC [Burkholderiales bacterium]|nr:squalene synthase HpnC [Burkholderiales bacterium]